MGSGGGGGIGGIAGGLQKIGLGRDTNIGRINSDFSDPLDLLGMRAAETRGSIEEILLRSAKAGVRQQENMEAQLREQYQPYRDAGVAALGKLSSLYMGDTEAAGYKPSELYEYQKEKGMEGITTQQSKMGLRESSATSEREAGLVSGLASEDIERYAGGLLSQVQMGSGAQQDMAAAGSSVSGQIGSLYSALGQGLNTNIQAYGQARQASLNTFGNSMSKLGSYMGQQDQQG